MMHFLVFHWIILLVPCRVVEFHCCSPFVAGPILRAGTKMIYNKITIVILYTKLLVIRPTIILLIFRIISSGIMPEI